MEELPKRKKLRLETYDYATVGYYFITICANRRNEDVFCTLAYVGAAAHGGPDPVKTILTPAGEIIDQLIQNINTVYPTVKVDIYCIMPDHVHLLLALQSPEGGPPWAAAPTSIPKVVNSLKALAVKRFGAPLWQRGYYDHVIRNDRDLSETRTYIQNNPLA